MSFGSLLRSLRTAAGLTQEDLAEAAQVSYRSISDLERGVSRFPRRDTARLLADALDLSGDDRAEFETAARGRLPGPLATRKTDSRSLPGGVAATRGLPRDIATFTGREPEIESVLTASAGGGADICAISGMAGAGKTALAVHAAHQLSDEFPDGQVFLPLHGHTPGQRPVDPADALATLLQASGVPSQGIPDGLEPRTLLWRDRLAGRRMLLVLDNAASSEHVAPLLPGDSECLVLITSRRYLGDLPGTVTPVFLDVLTPTQAALMFTRLAPHTVDSPCEVAEVARLAGFLPLAISLLARLSARHPSWTLADLAAETRKSLLLLSAEHDSVAAAFEVSYRNLDPARQRMFCLLGLHPGTSFEPYATAALAGTSVSEAAELLDALYGEGLLAETGHRRYGMHDLLRRYARDQAADGPSGSNRRAVERLLDYYQYTAAQANALIAFDTVPGPPLAAPAEPLAAPNLDSEGQALTWARTERSNLLACLDDATRDGRHARVVGLTAGIAGLLRRDGPLADAATRHATAAQAASRVGDRLSEANFLHHLGTARWRMDGQDAAAVLEQARLIYRELGNRLGQANALLYLGILQQHAGSYKSAAPVLEEALFTYRDLGDRLGQANALIYSARFPWTTSDYQGALQALEQALDISRDLGYEPGQGHALVYLGAAQRRAGDYPVAARSLEQALRIYRSIDLPSGVAAALNESGTLYWEMTEISTAKDHYLEALKVARGIASSYEEGRALAGLGRCAMANSDTAQGRILLRQALTMLQRIDAVEARDLLAEAKDLPAHVHPPSDIVSDAAQRGERE